ncbi:MAG TPA: hypothetical protein VML01_10395 [Bryobacterales bacterium]|nr:hypothetical protein [Bryobacterales bacterium]
MHLKDFVRDSIVQIIEGVVEAREHTKDTGAIVGPAVAVDSSTVAKPGMAFVGRKGVAQLVEFDVVVSISEGEMSEAKVGVLSGIIGAGVGGKSEETLHNVSRLKFSVPVLLPVADER